MELKKLTTTSLIIIVLLAVLSGCKKDDINTGSLKVTYTNHPTDLAAVICPAENPDLAITDWITPASNGTFTYSLNAGNYILTCSGSVYFPKVGFQIKEGETTEIVFDSNNGSHVK